MLSAVALAGAEAEAPEAEMIGAGAEGGAGAITTMAGPAKEVAAAANFSVEGSGAAGVAAFANIFDLVLFVLGSAVAAFCWSFFDGPLRRR